MRQTQQEHQGLQRNYAATPCAKHNKNTKDYKETMPQHHAPNTTRTPRTTKKLCRNTMRQTQQEHQGLQRNYAATPCAKHNKNTKDYKETMPQHHAPKQQEHQGLQRNYAATPCAKHNKNTKDYKETMPQHHAPNTTRTPRTTKKLCRNTMRQTQQEHQGLQRNYATTPCAKHNKNTKDYKETMPQHHAPNTTRTPRTTKKLCRNTMRQTQQEHQGLQRNYAATPCAKHNKNTKDYKETMPQHHAPNTTRTPRTTKKLCRNTCKLSSCCCKKGSASISKGASRNNREPIDTSKVLKYISTAMATLSAFERRLKTQANTNPIHLEL